MSKYHKGDKFIVEIKEVINSDNGTLYRSDFKTLTFDDNGLDKLQKYEEVQIPYSEAYNKGLEDGRNDAWKLANKIADTLTTSERAKIFGYVVNGITVMDILRDFTPQEALLKLEAYEKEQNEMKVGDVVFDDDEPDVYGIVTFVSCEMIYIVWSDGSSGVEYDFRDIKKTGKHIDIQSILQQIGGTE